MDGVIDLKRKIKNVWRLLIDKNYRFIILSDMGLFNWMSDEKYIKRMFKATVGNELDLDNPKTFNEKLQWLKLNNRKDIYTVMVDKYEAKNYVSKIIGEEYIIPTIGVWDNFDEIDFELLPNEFVLKCTHDSAGIVICKDKTSFNLKMAKKKIDKSLKKNFYYRGREWPYKNVKPRLIVEKYMEDSKRNELIDYKFYTFSGEVKAVFVASGRQNGKTKADYFDANFTHLDFTWGYDQAETRPDKPENFDKMKELATKLSSDIPHLRVDFYEVDGRIYFGELTFFDGGGFQSFNPEKWDRIFGDWINLNL